MTVQSPANHPLIDDRTVIVLLVLVIFGIAYAAFVRWLRRNHPNHGQTAWLVVGGDMAITVAYGVLQGLEAAVLLFVCMGAAGAPMVIEYLDDHLKRQDSKSLDIG